MQKRRPPTKAQMMRRLEKELPYLRERYGVARLALFGSYARGKPRPASDVDLLVELERPLGLEFEQFVADRETQDAVVRDL